MKTTSLPQQVVFDHGADLRAFSKHYHVPENQILDFSGNVNPLPLPERIELLFRESYREINRYPDPEAASFCEKISELWGVGNDAIVAGNGSAALLRAAIFTKRPASTLLVEPCFSEYRRALEGTGSRIHSLFLSPEGGFQFSSAAMTAKLEDVDLVILSHPNNPTGTALDLQDLCDVISRAQARGVSLLIDEAFVDWAPELSALSVTQDFRNLLIVRSLTKFFGLAGLRSGYAVGDPNWVGAIRRFQGPWTMNRIAEKISAELIQDQAYSEMVRQWFHKESAHFQSALQSVRGFKVFPSTANFFLVWKEGPSEALADFLGQRGIYIRRARGFRGLDDSFIRLSLRTREDNEKLIQALRAWERQT